MGLGFRAWRLGIVVDRVCGAGGLEPAPITTARAGDEVEEEDAVASALRTTRTVAGSRDLQRAEDPKSKTTMPTTTTTTTTTTTYYYC